MISCFEVGGKGDNKCLTFSFPPSACDALDKKSLPSHHAVAVINDILLYQPSVSPNVNNSNGSVFEYVLMQSKSGDRYTTVIVLILNMKELPNKLIN